MAILDLSRSPRPWTIEAIGHRRQLRIGQRTLWLGDVTAVEASTAAEVNVDGHMVAVGLFMLAGAAFVLPVVMNLIHPRFLAGGFLFIGIGVMALADILQCHGLTVHRVRISLADGTATSFASPDPDECRQLVEALGQR